MTRLVRLILPLCGLAAVVAIHAAAPTMTVSPTALSATTVQGSSAPSQTVTITKSGGGVLRWSVSAPSVSWLRISPLSGNNTATLTVAYPSAGLAAGTYSATFYVLSSSTSQPVSVSLTVTAAAPQPPPPPPPDSTRGPSATIVCPADAIAIAPGASIQAAVNAQPAGATFCLKAGIHPITSPITPKSGNTFVGEYGAILDGSTWQTTVLENGAFRAHNQDINTVTIRNLVIRKMPQRGIHTWSAGNCVNGTCTFSTAGSDGWIVENNEIAENILGLTASNGMIVRRNYIHHNVGPDPTDDRKEGGGFENFLSQGVLWEDNDVSYNAGEQKMASLSPNTIARGNYVHHNRGHGVWFDGENPGSLIENNRSEDNAGFGIFYEVSGRGTIRNNTVSRNGDQGILIATSHTVELSGNVLADNYRGIGYFVNCAALGSTGPTGEIGEPVYMQDISAHDNTITVGTRSGSWANNLTFVNCTTTQQAEYLNGSKNLTFQHNTYRVPSVTAAWWVWGDVFKSWSQWQALGQDTTGTVSAQ